MAAPTAIPLADLISALQRPEAYPEPPAAHVELVQTHISLLFLTESRVYKIKKPIKLEFLDYSTLEQRKHFCDEEVRLNRRLAPDVYLGVVPIVSRGDGMLRIGGDGEGAGAVIEYAVEMVRLPAERMLGAVLDRGEIDNEQIERIVDVLVRFHRDAPTGPGVDEFARPDELAVQADENLSALEPFVVSETHVDRKRTISRTVRDHLRRTALDWLTEQHKLLAQRLRERRIREGHGDLHAGNICLLRDKVVIYDCIEFSRRYRCRDVACELAFLAMDLDLRGFRGFAGYLLHQYAAQTGDPQLIDVAAFYKMHLAIVRGKVASLRAIDAGLDEASRAQASREAMRYFHLAAAYTLKPSLVLMCGLPATGKSFAARAIAQPFEAVVLRSDVVRKELAGRALQARSAEPIDAGIYTAEHTQRTYQALRERAVEQLRQGRTVIIDATFASAALRRPFLEAADELGVPCTLLEITCPDDVVRQRMIARAQDVSEVSDANWRVYVHAKSRFQPPTEVPANQRLQLDCRLTPEDITAAVIDQLVSQ